MVGAALSEAAVGVALSGVYVKLVPGSSEAVRFPQFEGAAVGRVSGVRGDRCVLDEARDPALAEVPLASVAPEPSRTNLATYLLARHTQAFEAGEQALLERLRELMRPRARHHYAEGLVLRRIQHPGAAAGLTLVPGVTVPFGAVVRVGPGTFPARPLDPPEYSFDPAGPKFARCVDDGLQRHGPYDAAHMRRREFRVLVVAPAAHKGDATVAVQKLLGGVNAKQNVFMGLKQMYRLERLQVTHVAMESRFGDSMQGYSEALRRALDAAPPGEPKFPPDHGRLDRHTRSRRQREACDAADRLRRRDLVQRAVGSAA